MTVHAPEPFPQECPVCHDQYYGIWPHFATNVKGYGSAVLNRAWLSEHASTKVSVCTACGCCIGKDAEDWQRHLEWHRLLKSLTTGDASPLSTSDG